MITVEGTGLHSGLPVKVRLAAAPFGSGISFSRDGKQIPAQISQLKDTSRGTSLNGVATVEHFLSAAYGIGAYDLLAEVDGEELPALDGSALPWVAALEQVRAEQKAESRRRNTEYRTLKSSLKLSDGKASLEALPCDGFRVEFVVNFKGFGEQFFAFDAEKQSYAREIAPARTFGYIEETGELKRRGLALGASLENALVFNKKGEYLNRPRFENELVRHKILDLIGDLALLGQPLKAQIKANCSGHKLNADLVRRILEQ